MIRQLYLIGLGFIALSFIVGIALYYGVLVTDEEQILILIVKYCTVLYNFKVFIILDEGVFLWDIL